MLRRWSIGSVSVLIVVILFSIGTSQNTNQPPEITFAIDFPDQISADGEAVESFIFFKDTEKDITELQFEMTEPREATLSFDTQVNGKLSGVIPFSIAATSPPLELEICMGEDRQCEKLRISDSAPGEVTLSVTLADEAGNQSEPKEFSFEVLTEEKRAILQVSPTSLSFQGQEGRPNPDAQTLQITNAGGGKLTWSASADEPWINLNPPEGTAPSTVRISVNISGLGAGRHQGAITITAPETQNSHAEVIVSLTLERRSSVTVGPGQSIQAAIDQVVEGGTIQLEAGSWEENIEISKSLTVKGSGRGRTTIEGHTTGEPTIRIQSRSSIEVVIEDLTAFGATGAACADPTLPYLICSDGISIHGKVKTTISNSQMSHNEENGLAISGSANVTIKNSTFSNNSWSGIKVSESAQLQVSGSSFSDNRVGGISASDSAHLKVSDSTFSGLPSAGAGIGAFDSTMVTIDNSTFSGYATGLAVRDNARTTVLNSAILGSRSYGVEIISEGGQVLLSRTQVSGSGSHGLNIGGSVQATIKFSTISNNSLAGLFVDVFPFVEGSPTVKVRKSKIEGNGTFHLCGTYDKVSCNGFLVKGTSHVTVVDSLIRNNTAWGIMAALRKCGWVDDEFDGEVILEDNQIYSNGKGQVCLP